MDLSDKKSYEKYEAIVKEENPNIIFLANCVDYGIFGEIGAVPLEDELRMVEVN
ncbi:hypothetical protein [Clostridium sp. BJN0013]|uniref:hypothetical protein n=1 Tax=Clostridium sp. BJN0013 TaxID=3236840 RepID=UPI0034C68D79